MARNDGIDRTSVRNLAVSDKAVGNTQQHNEREKDSYRNPDILPHRTEWNVHFKKPTASYTDLFAQMEAAGTISTRGLKPDATHYCELIFDVNSAYFDNHGGYEFAKQFYIGNRKVQELRTYDIEKFYATLAKTPCGQYVHGVKQKLSDKQKKRLLSSTSIHEVHTLLKTAFSYAVEWDLIHKIPLPREAPKANSEERTIWDEKTMLAALQTIENPALHLAVHMSMILSLREGEILGLQPSDLDFDAADGRGTISVSKTMQRANKDALEKLDPNQVYHTFPDRREGSKSSLILKKPKAKKFNRILYMTKPLKAELLAWLEKRKQDEQNAPEKYNNCGQLFRLPDGLPIAPELLTKWYRQWRSAHPEFEQIVFHGLRHSSATYQLLQSDGDFKSVQGNTGHATAAVLMDTYAHTQDKPRLELTEKIEANFYSQDLTPVAPQPRQNEKPAATKISGKEILEAIRLMDADERRELTRALFA